MKSLGLATDLLAMTGRSVAESHADRTVQRTPEEPDFWFGNRELFHTPPSDAQADIARFRADFPQAKHICLGWDVPNLPIETVTRAYDGLGFEIEVDDILTLTGDYRRVSLPEELNVRPMAGGDWSQSEEIALADMQTSGYPMAGMATHLRGRSATRRGQIADGLGQWFGVFDGDLLVADMGLFHNDRLARFQAVQTRESHRRRGICSALLTHVLKWLETRAPQALPVIVAAADSDAGRIYRRTGFALRENMVTGLKQPD